MNDSNSQTKHIAFCEQYRRAAWGAVGLTFLTQQALPFPARDGMIRN
jgi:hypothetical protein